MLLGVLGRFETDPDNISVSDRLFMATLAIVAFGLAVMCTAVLFFGFQFLTAITKALEDMENKPTTTIEGAKQAIQVKLIMLKVRQSRSYSRCYFVLTSISVCPLAPKDDEGYHSLCWLDSSSVTPRGVLR